MSYVQSSAKIYYTVDGTTPTQSSTLYTAAFRPAAFKSTVNLRAIAVETGGATALRSDNYVFSYPSQALDVTFGNNGIVTAFGSAGNATATGGESGGGVHIDALGRILVTGAAKNNVPDDDMIIWRYDQTGALDTTFGVNQCFGGTGSGCVKHDNAGGAPSAKHDGGTKITTDSLGRIYAVGTSNRTGGVPATMYLWRYTSTGVLDTGFNGTGLQTRPGPVNNEYGSGVLTDASNNVYLIGQSQPAGTAFDMSIGRFTSVGAPDPTFNAGAFINHHNAAGGAGNDYAGAGTFDASGKIITTGYSNGTLHDMTIWRINTNGTLDASFNGTGYFFHNNAAGGSNHDVGYSVIVDTSGNILVGGTSHNGTNLDALVWRVTSAGALDPTFGPGNCSNGVGAGSLYGCIKLAASAGGTGDDGVQAMQIDSAGRIYLGGYSFNGAFSSGIIWRLNANGTLDSTFGPGNCSNGVGAGGAFGCWKFTNTAGGNGTEVISSMMFDSVGRLLVVGYSTNALGVFSLVIWRINP